MGELIIAQAYHVAYFGQSPPDPLFALAEGVVWGRAKGQAPPD